MNNTKYRGINEIKIKLLPEKNKRDYILRLVSFIIILVFIITNFFLIFIPGRNLTADINKLSRELNILENEYQNIYDQIFRIDKELVNIKKNNEVLVIESKNIDYEQIVSDLTDLLPYHSYIENISYIEASNSYKIYVQFDTLAYLRTYEKDLNNIEKIDFVSSVITDKPQSIDVPEGMDRWATYFSIKIDLELSPKVGETNE
ncbi:MAG: hypothetical protein K0Q49_76 [Haloplasmataceae bacterium]|nr:hypothetical protein [Haloplasmataceae bacterium]